MDSVRCPSLVENTDHRLSVGIGALKISRLQGVRCRWVCTQRETFRMCSHASQEANVDFEDVKASSHRYLNSPYTQFPPSSFATQKFTMTEPDELYTLRAQFWLGHYQLALEEGKSIMRRPMSPALKAEREEFMVRSQLALGQYDRVISSSADSPGMLRRSHVKPSTYVRCRPPDFFFFCILLVNHYDYVVPSLAIQALQIKAQYESANDDSQKQAAIQKLQTMLGDGVTPSVQLTAAHVFLMAGLKKEALQCVHLGTTMEHICCQIQIYLQLERLDLAKQQLSQLKRADEDSILTQVASVHVSLATGSSAANDAIHTLNQLSEQYGPSIFLLNLMACACLQQGQYAAAEQRLEQARQEFSANDADTLVNLIVAYQYQQKPTGTLVQELKSKFPNHFLAQGLDIVEGAFEREAIKYRVAA